MRKQEVSSRIENITKDQKNVQGAKDRNYRNPESRRGQCQKRKYQENPNQGKERIWKKEILGKSWTKKRIWKKKYADNLHRKGKYGKIIWRKFWTNQKENMKEKCDKNHEPRKRKLQKDA